MDYEEDTFNWYEIERGEHSKMERRMSLTIGSLMSGGLITNYRCPSRCGHCLYGCGPKWEGDYITLEQTRVNVEKAMALGCCSLHIGGGEPFLKFDSLVEVAKTIRGMGANVEYIETNSSWFRTEEDARDKLRRLMDVGVMTLLLSISPFHNEYIPFDKVKGVIDACRGEGMGVFPWMADFVSDATAFDTSRTHSLKDYGERFGKDYLNSLSWRYSLTMRGRALETFRECFKEKTIDKVLAESSGRCSELADVTHFHLDLYGNYIPGLCTGLIVKVDELGAPLKESEYPWLNVLYDEGIAGLYKKAVDQHGYSPSRDGFLNKCDLCVDIRRYLVTTEGADGGLGPDGFYKYVFNDSNA